MDDVLCILERSDMAPIVLRAAQLLAWTLSDGRVRVLYPRPLRDPGFMPTLEEIEGDVPVIVAEAARTASIVVLAARAGRVQGNGLLEPQDVLRTAGRPIVVLPSVLPSTLGERVGIACDGELDLARLPAQVTTILRNAGTIHLLIRIGATDGRDAGQATIDALKAQGGRVDLHVMTSSEARLGHELVEEASRRDCDMLIMEAHSRSWLGTALYGRDSNVLAGSMLPILLHA